MRMLEATNIGGGILLSARYDGNQGKAFLLAGGRITAYPLDGGSPSAVGYGNSYCETESGNVRLKGEVPVYEQN